jgi:hypothetical protein
MDLEADLLEAVSVAWIDIIVVFHEWQLCIASMVRNSPFQIVDGVVATRAIRFHRSISVTASRRKRHFQIRILGSKNHYLPKFTSPYNDHNSSCYLRYRGGGSPL